MFFLKPFQVQVIFFKHFNSFDVHVNIKMMTLSKYNIHDMIGSK